ncbi:IDEAL domain-containing protein [Paenibacillus ferrarius]|uniref:IDEAL domain-containing protein n=1 Tax=Paenibacillus ferrarius TaxID=1469647 RepID=UPI003D27C266
MMNIAVSDWVVATTREDEMVHGFVDSIATPLGIGFVYVIASDRESTIGHIVDVNLASMKKLPEGGVTTVEQAKSMIDLALSVRDEDWFRELSEHLLMLEAKGDASNEASEGKKQGVNRISADLR